MNYDNIPAELKALDQWVFWRLEKAQNGRFTKIPYNARTGYKASTTNPLTWSSFDQSVQASANGTGIGFVFKADGGYVGLDIDHHNDPELVDWFGTYAEKSFSGDGVHIIMKGLMPEWLNGHGTRIDEYELYEKERYFVFTGDKLNDLPINDCQEKLDNFCLEIFPPPKVFTGVDISALVGPSKAVDLSIIDKIRDSDQSVKFNALWAGDTSAYGNNHSSADAALLAILRFWTGGNKGEAFALFRQSGLMREKAEKRKDYLERTWAAIDQGEVYHKVEPIPAPFITKVNMKTPEWRKVTIEHVREAIAGTILEPITKCLQAPTIIPLPLETAIAKALPLCGCAMTIPKKKSMDGEMKMLYEVNGRGRDLARLKIMSAGGQVSNFWTMLVGKSASGKDIGDIVDTVAIHYKWLIGNAGSEEGIADAYIRKGNGLLSISEMRNWMDQRHWQSRAASFLTSSFSKGHFSHSMSQRGQNCEPRESTYCYPNIGAAIQPGILEEYASTDQIDSGFLGRFLVIQAPKDFDAYPVSRSLKPEVDTVIACIEKIKDMEGDVNVHDFYSKPLNEMFRSNNAEPEPHWKRLANEYYPRLSLLLSIPPEGVSGEPRISPEGWERGIILIKWLFSQAEEVYRSIHFDPKVARFERLCARILDIIKTSEGGKANKSKVSQLSSRSTKAKEREEAIQELVSRGNITQETTQGQHSSTVLVFIKD